MAMTEKHAKADREEGHTSSFWMLMETFCTAISFPLSFPELSGAAGPALISPGTNGDKMQDWKLSTPVEVLPSFPIKWGGCPDVRGGRHIGTGNAGIFRRTSFVVAHEGLRKRRDDAIAVGCQACKAEVPCAGCVGLALAVLAEADLPGALFVAGPTPVHVAAWYVAGLDWRNNTETHGLSSLLCSGRVRKSQGPLLRSTLRWIHWLYFH